MTLLTTARPDRPPGRPEAARSSTTRGWFGQFVRRLHFYAGIFIGPFILIAAVSGALYSLTPQLEKIVYAQELSAPLADDYLPLADQIDSANGYAGPEESLTAVRPAPGPGDTTRIMYAGDDLGESESRAVFIDPATAEVRGDLTVYGTSGALPLRTWVDQLHRSLHLGDIGRLYSELAASWLGVVAVAGVCLWALRARRTRRAKRMLRPTLQGRGLRRTLSWHGAVGIWAALGMLFLSATGITWSQYGGGNFTELREAVGWSTPAVSTELGGASPAGDEHAHHHGHGESAGDPFGEGADPATFDAVLSAAQDVNVNTGLVEITPPPDDHSAWVVQEIQRSYPTEVDAVALDGTTLEVTDRVDFADFGLIAKLSRWGIDTHMGSMFGLPNQLLLFVLATGIACMVVWGYAMWWQRRPKNDPQKRVGVLPPRGAIRRAPWWAKAGLVIAAVAVGWFLPLLGVSLVAFVIIDLILGWRAAHRQV